MNLNYSSFVVLSCFQWISFINKHYIYMNFNYKQPILYYAAVHFDNESLQTKFKMQNWWMMISFDSRNGLFSRIKVNLNSIKNYKCTALYQTFCPAKIHNHATNMCKTYKKQIFNKNRFWSCRHFNKSLIQTRCFLVNIA